MLQDVTRGVRGPDLVALAAYRDGCEEEDALRSLAAMLGVPDDAA